MKKVKKILILGAGNWGCAFGQILSTHSPVWVWGRNREKMAHLEKNHQLESLSKPYPLSKNIHFTSDLGHLSSPLDLLVFAIPAQSISPFLDSLPPDFFPKCPIINLSKGIEMKGGRLLSTLFRQRFGEKIMGSYGVLSGPNLAEEIMMGNPATAVLASTNPHLCEHWAKNLSSKRFRIYGASDVRGVEIAGALKNVLAISAGICEGLKLGLNARAALLSRGLLEIQRFGLIFGGQAKTFMGLAGIGDIMATCFSPLSRNFRTGIRVANGEKIDDIIKNLNGVAEGIPTTRVAYEMGQKNQIYMPIIHATYKILFENSPPGKSVEELMNLKPKREHGGEF